MHAWASRQDEDRPYPLMGDSLKALVPGRPTTGQFAADDCDQRLTHVHGIHHVTVTATA